MAVKRLATVEKSFRVLTAVSERQPVGLSELARELELDKAGVQRILATLHHIGWILPSAGAVGGWELAPEALVIGHRYSPRLRDSARPHLEALQAASGETALLVAVDRDRAVVIDVVDSTATLRVNVPVGFDAPLADFGPFLPYFDDDTLAELGLPAVDPRTRDAARRNGWYTIDIDPDDVLAVGAPIVSSNGAVLGALMLVGPRTRLGKADRSRAGTQLRAAVASLVAELG
jgi:IclR family acetate operon transcriptional repressor